MDDPNNLVNVWDLLINVCLIGLAIVALDYIIFGPSLPDEDDEDGHQ